ncbi:transcription elongation factor S-II [Xylona heveae TC161]|uniref:Transcription elongation factor n=1 Tax=Xylona heveae (strain CBS 132557 / TC161) TaxID=1328760 RepID=A0A165JDT0_XYLHT|nr:transcription elongation factor S-II [Xylona heveae TC161]KZF26106.1 transcription elongation factor S-II [Xylona heveae TC161]
MDAKEIETRAKALQKAGANGEPASVIIDLLEDLKKNVAATEDLLRSTRIGIIVNRSKQHKDPAVARLASEIVSKWRSDVNKAKASPGKKANGSPARSANGGSTGSSPKPAEPFLTVAPEKRTADTDKVNTDRTGDAVRDKCLVLIYNGLAYMSEDAPSRIIERAVEVEQAAFGEFNRRVSQDYRAKIRSLFQNLKNKSNPGLRKRILTGELSASRFVSMSSDELKSAEKRAEDAKIQKELMNESMVAQAERSISTSFTCGKCGQKKVSYSQAQTRSADEPMTTFCECTVCGNRWKVCTISFLLPFISTPLFVHISFR